METTNIIKDPKLAKNRIFIGNIPACTREELESICAPYGKVLASLVHPNFGFIQFESEEIANRAAKALTRSVFKKNMITVRNAGYKQPQKPQPFAAQTAVNSPVMQQPPMNQNPDYNDCEIIVVNKLNTEYAEYIEGRLKKLSLRVDLLFPNEEAPLGKVLGNISARGCLYAILVTPQNQEHQSITVNILYGQPQEHRNMPVDDAINLIEKDFQTKRAKDATMRTAIPMAVPIIPPGNIRIPTLKERHPDAIQTLLNLLADNLPLTVLQYDRIIKYLQQRRELQVKIELGDAAEPSAPPDPEIELQKKILSILNKPSVTETHYELRYPTVQSLESDYRVIELMKDVRVQNALDSVMRTNLVSTIETQMKF